MGEFWCFQCRWNFWLRGLCIIVVEFFLKPPSLVTKAFFEPLAIYGRLQLSFYSTTAFYSQKLIFRIAWALKNNIAIQISLKILGTLQMLFVITLTSKKPKLKPHFYHIYLYKNRCSVKQSVSSNTKSWTFRIRKN